MDDKQTLLKYDCPAPTAVPAKRLVAGDGSDSATSFTFYDRIEVGRYKQSRHRPGILLVEDPTVSSRHCVVTQEPDGRCFVREFSRNGTRLDGRRLSPNLKTEIHIGQALSVGRSVTLTLDGDQPEDRHPSPSFEEIDTDTVGVSDLTMVTVLVGDIRGYTQLVQHADPAALQRSVSRVFDRLETEVEASGGTVKEFQGDAIFGFWEQSTNGHHVHQACETALHLRTVVKKLALDRAVWNVKGHRLKMDFALATGLVNISGYGNDGALGLSMVGEPVVLAYRIEKFANDSTGSIVACPVTHRMSDDRFKFKSIGARRAKGFDRELVVYSLVKAKKRVRS